jgi:hypothetical protein
VDEGVDLRARLHGGREVQTEAKGIAGAFSHLGQSLHRSDTQARHAGRSYAFATERLHILGHAAIGVRERTLGIAGAALGISTAVFGLEHVVRSSVEAWGEQRRSLAQTASVLRSTGGAANVTAEGVERLSATQSRLTGIEADQISQAGNMMLSFRQVRDEAGKQQRHLHAVDQGRGGYVGVHDVGREEHDAARRGAAARQGAQRPGARHDPAAADRRHVHAGADRSGQGPRSVR